MSWSPRRSALPSALSAVLALALGVLPTVVAVTPASAAPAGDLVVNGSFEDPVLTDGAFAITPTVPGWTSTTPLCGVEVERGSVGAAYDGQQNAELDSTCSSTITQSIPVTAGQAYTLSYAFGARPSVADNRMDVLVDGNVVASRSGSGAGQSAIVWTQYTDTVRAASGSLTLAFRGTDDSDSLGGLLDAVSLVPVAPYDTAQVAQNTSWPNAALLPEATTVSSTVAGAGEARWYRFPVVPSSSVQVDLTGLSSDADLTLFRDIGAAFTTLTSTADLTTLSAQFAGDAFSPSIYSPSIYSPSIYSPSIYSPSIYSPSIYSPSIYSPSIYSPSIYSPSIYSPSIYSPSIYSPSIYSPSIYSPDQAFLDAYASAQTRSLIGVSAGTGVVPETVRASTWNSTGSFYVRVQSKSDAPGTAFSVRLTTTGGPCNGFVLDTASSRPLTAPAASPTTVVLTDSSRLGLTDATARAAFLAKLGQLAASPTVDGVVVDAASVPRTTTLNAQADAHPQCTYAKNLVAQSLRDVVNGYRDAPGSHVRYVVVAGTDGVVPFFRYADDAGLGPESDYVPPVRDDTAAQASLRSNTLLGQDAYGTRTDLTVKGSVLPVPDLGVGRLVETPKEIGQQVDRFLAKTGGVLPRPTSSLVTGYDFLTSAADAVQADLVAGIGGTRNDTLITDQGVPTTTTTVGGTPDRRHSWTATDLSAKLFGSRHDVVFLAGHFSSADALAADYQTSLSTAAVSAHPGAFTDSLVFSAGCHSGYSLADGDGIAGLTPGLDWAQAMAEQGATLVAGTGYQYADTDFLAYSAKLYAQLADQLRTGTGPVRIGEALVKAKQAYLSDVGTLTGIDVKSLLESTLYGLPMTGLDLPNRVAADTAGPGLTPTPVAGGPGAVLGLSSAAVDTATPTTAVTGRQVLDLNGNPTGATYSWRTGTSGVQTSPALPALPQQVLSVSSTNGAVLRGVGFRSGAYRDLTGVTPLTGAPATEQNGVHTSFGSTTFWPHRLATPNYFGALSGGPTLLTLTPAQYRAEGSGQTATERSYSGVGLQLFYSANVGTYAGHQPAQAAPPSIAQVTGTVVDGAVQVQARVTGDPTAGIQSVWTTFTAGSGPMNGRWASVDLTQSATDPSLWSGSFALGAQDPSAVRFLVQAVNGVGLVGLDDALGDGYVPVGAGPAPVRTATTTAFTSTGPTTGRYGDTASVPVTVTGVPAGSPVSVSVGNLSATGSTAADGTATVRLPLRLQPGSYLMTASYAGDATHLPSATSRSFTVQKAITLLLPNRLSGTVPVTGDPTRVFTLTTGALVGGTPLPNKSVLIDVLTSKGVRVTRVTRTTDQRGQVDLGGLQLVKGSLGVVASFAVAALGSPPDPAYLPSISGTTLDVK